MILDMQLKFCNDWHHCIANKYKQNDSCSTCHTTTVFTGFTLEFFLFVVSLCYEQFSLVCHSNALAIIRMLCSYWNDQHRRASKYSAIIVLCKFMSEMNCKYRKDRLIKIHLDPFKKNNNKNNNNWNAQY